MSLSASENLALSQILRIPYADISTYAPASAVEDEVRGYLLQWASVKDKYISFQSGGATVNPEEARRVIRERVGDLLGYAEDAMQMLEIDTGASALYG